MKRPIVITAMVYIAGLFAGRFLQIPPLVGLCAVAVIVASQAVVLARGRRAADSALFVALFLAGVIQQQHIRLEDTAADFVLARLQPPVSVRVEGEVASEERSYPERRTWRLKECRITPEGGEAVFFPTAILMTCRNATLAGLPSGELLPGDRIAVDGVLDAPPGHRNPEVFDYAAYLRQQGVGATLSVPNSERLMVARPHPFRGPLDLAKATGERLRHLVERTLEESLAPESAAIVRSILLGQAYRLDADTRRDFARCGVAHFFAVSGLHVGILAGILTLIVRLFGAGPGLRAVVVIAGLWMFCAAVGLRTSAFRAAIMLSAVFGTSFTRYRIEPLTALATAAFAILVFCPRALGQAGFQLSFLCVLSIFLVKPALDYCLRVEAYRDRASSPSMWLWNAADRNVLVYITLILAAQLGVLPLLAHYYHQVPVLGLVANFPLGILVGLLVPATLLMLGAAVVLPGGAGVLGATVDLLATASRSLIEFWVDLPAVAVRMPPWPPWVTALYYAVLFGWAVLPRQPSPFFWPKQRARISIAVASIAAWVVWAPLILGGSGGELRATFLDVGQGESCVVELPGGQVVLIDGGDSRNRAGRNVVAPFLEARGIDAIDLVIATHADSDHIGGLPEVFDRLRVVWLAEGPSASNSEVYRKLIDAAAVEPAERDTLFAGDSIEGPDGLEIRFLHPAPDAAYSNRNDASLVILIDWRDCEILIPGDIEEKGERDLLASGCLEECDVLKVAHHGAVSVTSAEFLERVRPAVAIISCGRNNSYGHPAPGVLDRLTSAGATILRTDRDGAVTIRSNGSRTTWEATVERM